MSFDLHGRVALVTGGGSGMGFEISQRLAALGADLAISYARSDQLAEQSAETLRGAGSRCIVRQADLRRVSQAEGLVDAVLVEYGRLDVVVNSAGTTRFINFEDLAAVTEAVWDDILDVNLKGAFFLSRAAGVWMRDHGQGGAIVHVASTAAFSTRGSSLPYTVAKAGVVQLTRTLAQALAPSVRVNAVAPGTVATKWWDSADPGVLERVRSASRFKRLTSASDVADAAVLLVTNESMSGQTIVVDLASVMH